MDAETLPPPDITKDKLFLVIGGSFMPVHRPVELVAPANPVWVTAIPTPPLTEMEAGSYPRERHFQITHAAYIGTVPELVELYRTQLTNAYNSLICKPADGEAQPVIPFTGEASLRKQNTALDQMCNSPGVAVAVPANASPAAYEAFLAPRYAMGEPKPRQSAVEVDRLKRLVASYHNYRFPDAESHSIPPTDDPKKVQELIDALTTLKADAEARHPPKAA